MEKLRVGDPLDKAIDIGAIVAPVQLREDPAAGAAGRGRGRDACGSRRWACPTEGYFFPPTLFTDVAPAATIAQVEIFGPVLVAMTFRTPAEAVALANNTRYGLAASVWSENINLALDVARADQGRHGLDQLHQPVRRGLRLRRLSRERLRPRRRPEGLYEYVRPAWEHAGADERRMSPQATVGQRRDKGRGARAATAMANGTVRTDAASDAVSRWPAARPHAQALHRRQAGAARLRLQPPGPRAARRADLGEVGEGNRKDIRNAVEAAHAAAGWASADRPHCARRSSTTSPRTSRPAPTSSPRASPA